MTFPNNYSNQFNNIQPNYDYNYNYFEQPFNVAPMHDIYNQQQNLPQYFPQAEVYQNPLYANVSLLATAPVLSDLQAHNFQQYQPTNAQSPIPLSELSFQNPPYIPHYQELNNLEQNSPSFCADPNVPSINPNHSSFQAEPPVEIQEKPALGQIAAWVNVIDLYTKTLIMAAEKGITKIETPDLEKYIELRKNSFMAQRSLRGKALCAAVKLTHVASIALKILALAFLGNALLHTLVPPFGLPVLVANGFISMILYTASKSLQVVSNLLKKAEWSNFTENDKIQIEILKKWQEVTDLKSVTDSIEATFQSRDEAMKIDNNCSNLAERCEWNGNSNETLTKILIKISAYNAIVDYSKKNQQASLLNRILKA
jgi:hypothetical protein